MINKLAKEFKGKFECLGENAKKYITYLVPIKNEFEIIKQLRRKHNFLIVLDLCQVHYPILLITFLKDLTLINAQISILTFNIFESKINY